MSTISATSTAVALHTMSTAILGDSFYSPLAINLSRQIGILIPLLPSHHAHAIEEAASNTEKLRIISRILAMHRWTMVVERLFRPVLMDLCARWLDEDCKDETEEERLAALGLLIEVHEELYPILHKFLQKALFQKGPLGFLTSTSNSPGLSVTTQRLNRLLLTYYRFLQANRELPSYFSWPLAPLSLLIWSDHPNIDAGVKVMAIRCYALQSGMGELEREKLEREVLRGGVEEVDCWVQYEDEVQGGGEEEQQKIGKKADGWILPVLELERVKEQRDAILADACDYYGVEDEETLVPIHISELSPHIENVHGVLLLRSPNSRDTISPLISTTTTTQALRSLALHISLRVPILLTSSPSSGKSLFLSHLSQILHSEKKNQIITIHLADTSLDPRSLLGSYVSSPTRPGTFEWKEGVLVRSMREGKWVVLEDADRGSGEVLGVIKPLVESLRLGKWIGGRASLDVPSRGRVVADEGFALFATRSVMPSRNGAFPSPTFFGAHKFHEVIIPSPSVEELRIIVNARYSRLAGDAAKAFIRLWEDVKNLGSAASTRDIGLRELEKFCTRVEKLLPASYQPMDVDDAEDLTPSLSSIFPNPALREDMYLEARDVFFGAGTLTASARTHVDSIALVIGKHLGLDAERREWVLRGRTPDFDIEKDVNGRATAVLVGRTRLLARNTKMGIASPVTRPFAMHRPAVMLLSRIATAVSLCEPVLLTGETGTGKTSVVTHLASLLHRPLISLNLSHQTESSDLLGGFKPVDARAPGGELQSRFLDLFGGTFSRRKNEKFESEVRKAVGEGKWKRAVGLWKESTRLAMERIRGRETKELREANRDVDAEMPRKRRKVDEVGLNVSEASWLAFSRDVEEFEVQYVHGKGKFAFAFVEGPLVRALRSGDWVLLDEINLASPETLECITSLLHGPTASITLTEQGSLEPVPRHPDFRLFACMNPATDVGKKDLPPNIRSRFTEIDVPPPDADRETLLSIVAQYIGPNAVGDKGAILNVAEFYSAVKDLAEKRQIADGSNHRPHYSMRTLARALTFAADTASTYSLRRAIWEGCLMAFTMVLDSSSAEAVTALAHRHLLAGVKNPRSMLMREPTVPRSSSAEFVKFGPFYLERGPLPEELVDDYIMTPSVEAKLIDLARIVLTRRFPILIEGPTSSGKTSSVEYLARRTGHRFIRINNHEHTDIQEYIGSYVSDPMTGKLVFKDGLLVRALRNGDWIVLDELNLAPTDVLEALNRLLDDNRELVIPETQEVVQPHPHFMLFATQNPPGLYAGRKVLSRAFRNRFLEVHFEDVPQTELETILCQRCQIAPSYGKKIVSVFHELQKRRQSGRVFESKHGFATLRDLFRWAGRDAVGYQELAENGYMLLAERARRDDDKVAVKEVIESVMGVTIDESSMYNLHSSSSDLSSFLGCPIPSSSNLIWTNAMQRLFILVGRALRFNEPVLLVGETGSGKTSVCQVFAEASSQRLHGLNCHQNTETADLIGGLRPVRNRSATEAEVYRDVAALLKEIGAEDAPQTFDGLTTSLSNAIRLNPNHPDRSRLLEAQRNLVRLQSIFEWHDGPLVEAMRNGDVFLLDEISLADDSVLERLNSVLEPGRTIVLAERGGDDLEHPAIHAADAFKLIATMNPGGDYGKKELSPALRNRFTEIWVPRVDDRHDLEMIVGSLWQHEALKPYTAHVLDFIDWLCTRVGDRSLMSLRDILAWVVFSNSVYRAESENEMPVTEIFHHAAHMTYIDGLGSLPQLSAYAPDALRRLKGDALSKLQDIVPLLDNDPSFSVPIHDPVTSIQLGSFAIPKGARTPALQSFNFQAPTTQDNAMRVVRACQVPKPILLEGSPGVGKTSLVTALANLSGHELCRINLSDQTDLIDLFGSDLPVEGGGPGEFAWKDAEFLKALQEGHWVLLDEMNLAPQAVLEGLNAVLDHRGTVYIPELSRSFVRHPSFRIFAAQNPLNQGGGRKGLPKSFVNRFTKVYIEELSPNDLYMVCHHLFPDFDEEIIKAMISFNMHLHDEVAVKRRFAREGSPWEFNLRDVIRWGTLLRTPRLQQHPVEHLRSVYLHRFRTAQDREEARSLFDKAFSMVSREMDRVPHWSITSTHVQIGHFNTERKNFVPMTRPGRILKMQLSALEAMGHCAAQSWLSILTGPRNSGKTDVVRALANFTGNDLREISVNSATDTMDILGSFEQVDFHQRVNTLVDEVRLLLENQLRLASGSNMSQEQNHILGQTLRPKSTPVPLHVLLQTASSILANLRSFTGHAQPAHQALEGNIESLLAVSDTVGRFEWVDGPLIHAMKHGYWVLMDGANLCNPSVLDRLNSLCEPDGFLTLSERGYVDGKVQVIRPHANFRLFMSVDPQYGELSRAMRNRGMEIALISVPVADDSDTLWDYLRLPQQMPLNQSSKFLSLVFDASRRGLYSQTTEVPLSAKTSGRALDQQSALSSLVDHGPMIIKSTSSITDSHLFFLARVIEPAYIPYFRRFTTFIESESNPIFGRARALLQMFSSHPLAIVMAQIRDAYSLSRGVSSAFVLAQPMDFYLNDVPSDDGKLQVGTVSAHRIILQVLDLVVALFLDEEDSHANNPQGNNNTLGSADKNQRALKTASAVMSTARAVGHAILQNFKLADSTLQAQTEHIELASIVLGHCRHLRNAIKNTSFDFSAVQAISRWIMDSVKANPPAFNLLAQQALALNETVSLSSGLGLIEIWTALFLDQPLNHDMGQLEKSTFCLKTSTNAARLRRQAFDFMALNLLPTVLKPEETKNLRELQHDLEHRLQEGRQDDKKSQEKEYHTGPLFLIAELGVLALYNDKPEIDLAKSIEELIELVCQDIRSPLLHMVSYQHLIWTINAKKKSLPVVAQIYRQWLNAVWLSAHNIEDGPSVLLRPALLNASVSICNLEGNPLISWKDYEASVNRQVQLVFLQCDLNTSRTELLARLLHHSTAMIVSCFGSSFENRERMQHVQFDSIAGSAASMKGLLSLIEQSDHIPLQEATRTFLRPAIKRLGAPDQSTRSIMTNLGLCWVAVGRMMINLLVPDAPIDPAAIQNCAVDRWQYDKATIASQLHLHSQLEELCTGNATNDIVNYLKNSLDFILTQLSNAPALPVRKDISRLHMFWSEVSQFQNHVIAVTKLDDLLHLLQQGGSDAMLREQVTQQSMAGFCQRLDTVYTEYADISAPLQLAILHLRMGLRLVAHSVKFDSDAASHSVRKFSTTLSAFPSIQSSASLCADPTIAALPDINVFRQLLLNLSAIGMEISLGVRMETQTDLLDSIYGQALRLWLIDRAKENDLDEASQSLYRRKLDYDAMGEAEIEEEEFLALFPSFENALENEAQSHTESKTRSPTHVQSQEFGALVTIHHNLFHPSLSFSGLYNFNEVRKASLEIMLTHHVETLHEILDCESLPFQISILHERLSGLKATPNSSAKPYDFYIDPNIHEIKRAVFVVVLLMGRLEDLIQEWPDQMVLHNLKSRCDTILGLNIHSPVAKILSALEQLLIQTEDWEIYSNRGNTLKAHQRALTELIVDWRRLELSCWQGLLESQAKIFAEGVSEWWFRLYDASVRGPLDAADREQDTGLDTVSEYLDTLIPLLDNFLSSSPLGQFQARMKLLQSFETYILHLRRSKSGHQRSALERVQRVLHATWHYFNLFSISLSTHLSEQRTSLEKEIRGFIKLASWKDINVQALKQSAQRTHHQLYKIIRKFRDVLRQPISERLSPQLASDMETKYLRSSSDVEDMSNMHPEKIGVTFPDGDGGEAPTHLANLTRTFSRFDSLISTRIRRFVNSRSTHIVDSLAVDIIVTAKELAAISVPTDAAIEVRQKQGKALLVRKRKAWSDLLKELKRVGLAVNVKPDVLRQHMDLRWIREQPIMPSVAISSSSISTEKSEDYFFRLYSILPNLRSSVRNHHSDLNTRELQRGIMLLESGFSMAVDLRSRLAMALSKYEKLSNISHRLKMVIAAPQLAASGHEVLENVSHLNDVLCRLVSALHEVHTGVKKFDELHPRPRIPEALLDETRDFAITTNLLQERLRAVITNLELTSSTMLLQNEYVIVNEVYQRFSESTTILNRWSSNQPRLNHLFQPVEQWLSSQDIQRISLSDSESAPLGNNVDIVINCFLISVQAMIAHCSESPEEEENDVDDFLFKDYRRIREFTHLLNIDTIISHLDTALHQLIADPESLQRNLQRILPFLDTYMSLVKDQLAMHSQWTKALFKLNFVLCSVMQTLSTQGFCKPPDIDEKESGGDGSEAVGGVGLGEGGGSENVSKDIEDESQVEGLQGEDAEGHDPKENKGDDDAIEMNEDFGGDMEDVPDTGSQEDGDSDRESEVDPEEKLANLDASDPSAVDEKMWGDEKGPEDPNQADDKTGQDRSEEQAGDSEVVAKEGTDQQQSKEKADEKEKKEGGEENVENPQDENMPEGEENEEGGDPDVNGAPMDDYVQDANTLDLPDDMDLGLGDDMPESIGGEAEEDEDDLMEDIETEPGNDNTPDERGHEEPSLDAAPEPTDQEQEMETPGQVKEGEGEDNDADNQEAEQAVAQPDVSAGDGADASNEKRVLESGESASTGDTGGSEGAEGQDAANQEKVKDKDGPPQNSQPQADPQSADSQTVGTAAAVSQEGQAPSQPDRQTSTNPLRSLGDALKEIRQRFDEIQDGEKADVPHEPTSDAEAPSQVEYLQPEDVDHDMQALGPAGEEQAARLNELKLVDGDNLVDETMAMDVDSPLGPENHERPSPDLQSQTKQTASEHREDVEGAILQGPRPVVDLPAVKSDDIQKADIEMEDDMDNDIEAQLRDWKATGYPDEGSEHIWRLYESLTHDLAYALCEQLRLILEPTLATRLKGDYRTGKRLNMKKIISYIASDYTKDKIWLRRTRPSQREYQVLIAIDDSRSMAESHSVHLAYETLALVSKALSRLESGDIAIAKFGENVEMLHGFDEGPFTDQAGTKVMNAFRFNQKATNVLSLVDTSLKVLEVARERRAMSSASAADLWQLEIIISDGMCQDHDQLRTVLRKAEEQRVMIVFIIIDSLNPVPSGSKATGAPAHGSGQGSILSMDKAEFKNVDGRMELQLQKYLDSFPFEYYVVLRSVEALPEVLSGTLKQFFERISEE